MADYAANGLTTPLGVPVLMDLQGESDTIPFPLGRTLGTEAGPRLMDLQGQTVTVPLLTLGENGGVGAFLKAVVIQVVAGAPSVVVTLDRPMIYGGAYEQTPPGSAYGIGQPALDLATERELTIPITTAPGSPTFVAVAKDANGNRSASSAPVRLVVP
jgi:hypothetical protein